MNGKKTNMNKMQKIKNKTQHTEDIQYKRNRTQISKHKTALTLEDIFRTGW